MAGDYRVVSAEEAVQEVQPGDSIHLSSLAAVPRILVDRLVERGQSGALRDVRLRHLNIVDTTPFSGPEYDGVFHSDSFFIGDSVRRFVADGYADYIPAPLHETARFYRDGILPCDVAMIQVSKPDRRGRVSLGISVDLTLAAVQSARRVIAVVNPEMPYTYGDGVFPLERCDLVVEHESPLPEHRSGEPTAAELAVGRHCAELIEDGSCLQLGIGGLPNSILRQLGNHRHLGIHSEMVSDGVIPLIESGVIDNSCKKLDRGRTVVTFLMGSQRLYRFAHRNRALRMKCVYYTNDPFVIARQPKMVAINSALQVDLTGQVCADSLGTRMYSGNGGQLDFIYGASRSEGGKPIIALTSRTNRGISRIVPELTPGAGVVTPRSHIHYLVTEFGAVNLFGRNLQERARLIIDLAHPECREELERAAVERFGPRFLKLKVKP